MRCPLLIAVSLCLAVAVSPAQRRNKEEEEITQTLEVLQDPPMTVTAETSRLVFDVSPLTAKGLLSQQVRDALRILMGRSRRARFVKLRALVAGSGDMRRVRDIVSEVFTDRRQPLPALSVVQVGGLPLQGAQVVIESVAVARREQNPHGLAWFSGQQVTGENPLDPALPLVQKAVANLGTAVRGAGADPADVLRVTCFLSALTSVNDVRVLVGKEFPSAIANHVQVQRAPVRAIAECEAVGRNRAQPAQPVVFLNPEGLPKSPNYSQVALVGAPRVVFSGAQMAFRFQESDAQLAFERLAKALEEGDASPKDVVFASAYPLSSSIAELVRKVRFGFFDKSRPPASTMLPFEGLPSMDASFAIDVVAVPKQ
jgi:enamine deaminase RidA (YjgF/YER057c/UK114 family)